MTYQAAVAVIFAVAICAWIGSLCLAAFRRPRGGEAHEQLPDGWESPVRRVVD